MLVKPLMGMLLVLKLSAIQPSNPQNGGCKTQLKVLIVFHKLLVFFLKKITPGELIDALAVFVNLYIFHIGYTVHNTKNLKFYKIIY